MKNFYVRRRAHWMVMSLWVAVAACGSDSPTDDGDGDPVATDMVRVGNNFFTPEPIVVAPSTMVTWTWDGGGDVHNVTFASSVIPNSATQASGTYVATMPATSGVFAYQCTIHPADMNGTVTVQ